MTGPASIRVQLLDGETVVHEYRRSTSRPDSGPLKALIENALGWLQSYQASVSGPQWEHDAAMAREAQGRG